MAGKTLNAKNLEALGPERLAELVMDLVQGSAPLKREARAALLEASGSEALGNEVRKRLATIKRSKTWVGWKKRKGFLREFRLPRPPKQTQASLPTAFFPPSPNAAGIAFSMI